MKPHHIDKLFQNTAIGDQVQFEDCIGKFRPTNTKAVDESNTECIINSSQKSLNYILSKFVNGSEIRNFYELNGKFTESQRTILINNLASYIHSNRLPYTLTDCADLGNKIVAMFLSEQLEFYTHGRRRRLYNKLSNLRKTNKEFTVKKANSNNHPQFHPEQNAKEIAAFMRSEGISVEQLDSFWTICSQYRFQQIKQSASTQEVLKNWPDSILDTVS